jgi:arsenate reductase
MANLRVLFVCTHNGARSRIAEEFANLAAPGRIDVCSASIEAEKTGPLPVFVMKEVGVELRTSPPKSIFERFREKELFDYVIAICDPESKEQVPIFLSGVDTLYHKTAQRLNWIVPNFRSISGTDEDKKAKARLVRDRIKAEVLNFLSQLGIKSDFV